MVETRSQNGEHVYLLELVDRLGLQRGFALEIGVDEREGVVECNTGALLERPTWSGLLVDEDPIDHPYSLPIRLSALHHMARLVQLCQPDVFSLDVDGNDYWFLEAAMQNCKPAIVICEYNVQIEPVTEKLSIPFDPAHRWDGSQYFGASAGAMVSLMRQHDYKLYCDVKHVNLFFVHKSRLPKDFVEPPVESLAGPIVSWLHSDHYKREYVEVP